jgi:hypothetical protein
VGASGGYVHKMSTEAAHTLVARPGQFSCSGSLPSGDTVKRPVHFKSRHDCRPHSQVIHVGHLLKMDLLLQASQPDQGSFLYSYSKVFGHVISQPFDSPQSSLLPKASKSSHT